MPVSHTNMDHLSIYHTNGKLMSYIFSLNKPPQWINARPHLKSISKKCLFQGHNILLPSREIKPRYDNLVNSDFHFYPLNSCNLDISVKGFSQKHSKAMCPV